MLQKMQIFKWQSSLIISPSIITIIAAINIISKGDILQSVGMMLSDQEQASISSSCLVHILHDDHRIIHTPLTHNIHAQGNIYKIIILLFFHMQNAKGFSDKCNEYFDGFYLQNGYNKNVAPHKNLTVFQLQHVNNIVKVC